MKNVLITGSNGFIGKALKHKLLLDEYKIYEMNSDSDITNPDSFMRLQDENINHVFHLAAKTFVPDSWKNPQPFFQTNVMGTVNVLEFCKSKSISLTFLSAYIYGNPKKLPICENDLIEPNNPYAQSKYIAEQICEFYSKEFGANITIIRPFNVYGKGQNEKFLIPYIIKQAIEDKEIKVKDLIPKRDYVFLEDLLDALILSIGLENRLGIYNIGSGYSLSVRDIINIIQHILGVDKPIRSENNIRKNEINDVIANISKANQELGWYPKHSFYEGVEKVIRFEKSRL